MPSTVHPDVLDGALSALSSNADLIVALSSDPATYGEATGAAQLSSAALSIGDFTLEDNAGGRQLAIGAKSATAAASGTASHIAVLDTSTSRVLFSASISGTPMNSGDVVQFTAWSIALAPAA